MMIYSTAYETAFRRLMIYEGPLSKEPNDNGNWTGGKVGVGILKGTAWGISAASYPDVDIEHLDQAGAKPLFYRDFWAKHNNDSLRDPRIAGEIFEQSVNFAVKTWGTIVQRSVNFLGASVVVDGFYGEQTLRAVNAVKYPNELCLVLNGLQLAKYIEIVEKDPTQKSFARGWLRRIEV